jgi:hypothetical protein
MRGKETTVTHLFDRFDLRHNPAGILLETRGYLRRRKNAVPIARWAFAVSAWSRKTAVWRIKRLVELS